MHGRDLEKLQKTLKGKNSGDSRKGGELVQGLPLCKKLVESSNGAFEVYSSGP